MLPEELEDVRFDVAMASMGYVYYASPLASFTPGLGVRGSAGFVESGLEPFYGTRMPLGAMVFVQVRPAAMPP